MRELLLSATVEKVCDVRVLLGFGHAVVLNLVHRKDTGQNVTRHFRRKRHRQWVRFVVHGEADKVSVRTIRRREIGKAGHGDRTGDLPRAIRAKVEEDDRIAVFDFADRIAVIANTNDGFDKLVGDAACVRGFDGCDRIGCLLAFAAH